MTNHPLRWFIDRIGKTVYRDDKEGNTHPIFIKDIAAARYYHLYAVLYKHSYRDNP